MVWRTTANNNEVARALTAFSEHVLEVQLRASDAGLGAAGIMRVGLLRPRSTAGSAFSDAVFRSLRFNGKSALDNGYDFRELTYDDTKAKTEYPAKVEELLRFRPHLILYAGGASILREVFTPLEAAWPKDARERPRYASVALLTPESLAFIGESKDRRRRFFGVTPVSTTQTNARLVTHYNETFDDKITRTYAPNTIYDAFYMLAYATFAIDPKERVTGPAIARAFEQLGPPGLPVEVGLSGIFDAHGALRAGKKVDVMGATGALDFDLATGETPFDYAILCAGTDERGRAMDGIESGLVYSASTASLHGAMKCP
jgi:branched-chain amino acid transport system substrate-binding protein